MMTASKKDVAFKSNRSAPALATVVRFMGDHWQWLLASSAVVMAPCLWHQHIEAGDLPSHVYNAWLVHLVESGQAPGLWLAHRWNNVLFDFVLSGLGPIFGWGVAEKIAVCGSVLIFCWGAFSLVSALTQHVPWFLLPCLAMIVYGWTFEMGFMNCYISLGLAFFGLAILARGRGWERGLAAVLAPIVWLAHPLGLVLLVGVGAYIVLARNLRPRDHVYLLGTSVILLVGIHFFIQVRYPASSISWKYDPPFVHDGTDQLLLWPRYMLPARMLRAFVWACLLFDVIRRRHEAHWWLPYALPAQLYFLSLVGAVLLPAGIDTHIFHQIGFLSIGFLTERLTSVSAVFLCCLLGVMKPKKWHLAGFAAIAAVFFCFLHSDTAAINRTEAELDRKVREVPPGSRVVAAVVSLPGRVTTHHIIDRACIGRCFSYSNYEASSEQFRVRANQRNPFVMVDTQDAWAAQTGTYVVRATDLPLFDIYQCDSSTSALCVRELAVGDKTSSTLKNTDWFRWFNAKSLLVDISLSLMVLVGVYLGHQLTYRLQPARI